MISICAAKIRISIRIRDNMRVFTKVNHLYCAFDYEIFIFFFITPNNTFWFALIIWHQLSQSSDFSFTEPAFYWLQWIPSALFSPFWPHGLICFTHIYILLKTSLWLVFIPFDLSFASKSDQTVQKFLIRNFYINAISSRKD